MEMKEVRRVMDDVDRELRVRGENIWEILEKVLVEVLGGSFGWDFRGRDLAFLHHEVG